MARRKQINYEEQFKNSQNFLNKLQNIKKTSKDIKQKNKLTFHRNIWVKEFKYLSRLQRDFQHEIHNYLQHFDNYFKYEIQQQQIFKNEEYNTFNSMKNHLSDQNDLFTSKIYKQIEHLPLLVDKCQKLKKQEINNDDILSFIKDIDMYLQKTAKDLNMEHDEVNKYWNNQQLVTQQLDEEYEDIVYYMKPIADEVKGFDFKQARLKKIQQGQQHLLQYLLTYKDRLTSDQISEVIQEFNHASNLLNQTLELQIQKINLDYEDVLNFTHPIINNHITYQKFVHLYQIYMGRGKSLIQYFQRLSIQFPKVSKVNIQHINDYIVGKLYKQRKIKAVKRNFLREKQELFYKVQKEVNLRIQKKIKDAQKQAQKLLRKQEKLKLEKQLQYLREQYNKRQEDKQKQQAVIEQQKRNQQKKKEALRRLYLQDLGKRAQQVKQLKIENLKKISEEEKLKKMKQQNLKKQKIVENQPKVKQRQSIQRKKIQKKVQIREYKQKQQQINEQRINKAIQQYPFRPQVQFSEERLNALTQAQVLRKDTKYDKADKIELTKMTGYTVNQLMSDMRYRLNSALNEAGIGNTQYAKQIIIQMSKPT